MSIAIRYFLFEVKKMIEFDNCRDVINRTLLAYKVKTVKALSLKWGITPSVIASRIQRNSMPADIVLRCVMDTGANPQWLCTGKGEPNIEEFKTEKKPIEVSTDALEKLERIAALKKDGAITEDEYNLLKGSIFNN